jgi:polyhydroxybutyrate depolymerase
MIALAALLLTACSDESSRNPRGSGEIASRATTPTGVAASATRQPETGSDSGGGGCAPARPHAPGDSDGSITSRGLERTYLLHVPPSYDGASAVPLVINLHGFGSNAREQASYSRFPQKGDEEGFIVVSPNGTGEPQRWTFPGLGEVDEPAFIADLLDKLQTDLCIDETRVFAAGMSNGAAISTFIACALPDRIAAIAEVAATAGPRACGTDAAIPIITFRGTEDFCVPYQGGTSACGMRLPVVAAEEAIRLWGEHDGCDPAPAVTQVAERVRATAYSACNGFVAAILYTIEGGGHTWPGSIDLARLGATTHEIDATDLIWEFFVAHGGE